jgi:hypothetical protein
MESLDELPVLHFILVIEGEEGLGTRVRCIPEFEGRPTLARELLLRPYKRQPCVIGPPGRCLGQAIPNIAEALGRSGASTISTSAFCFPLSEGGSSTVRSITAGIDPWGRADVSTDGGTACTLDGGTTTPHFASIACSAG